RANPSEKPKAVYPTIDDFMRLAVSFYRTIGMNPYESSSGKKPPVILFNLFFAIHMVNLIFVLAMEILYVVLYFRDEFLESCMVMSYIGFVVVGCLKISAVIRRKDTLTTLVRELESFFPPPRAKEQEQYAVRYYLERSHLFTKGFGGLYMTLVITYNLFSITQYTLLRLVQSPNAKQSLPYVEMAPWDYTAAWRFLLTYISQSTAGYTATCAHVGADLMIFAVAMQMIMHFDRVARVLREFQVRARRETNGDADEVADFDAEGAEEDLRELRSLVAYHNKILGITDIMNEVFGIPLLLNFAASSLLVCFVGFQMTFVMSPQQVGKLILILVSANSEIYLICSFSQMLIDASESVCYAAYEMNWTGADQRFRKMLIFIALRAQKPICLKATVFLDISIETMSIFLRMSYKFFCAIRTMYQ
ncbi:hypothetical protein KR009_004407, partial [Drosophila setifemur]